MAPWEAQAGTKKRRMSAEQRNLWRYAAPVGQARGGRDYPRRVARRQDFEAGLDENLDRLHRDLREQTYQPQAVRRLEIPKRGAPGKTRPLGIPSVYDRVCQQAL